MGRRNPLEKLLGGLPLTMVLAGVGDAVGWAFGAYDPRLQHSRRASAMLGVAGGLVTGLFASLTEKDDARGV